MPKKPKTFFKVKEKEKPKNGKNKLGFVRFTKMIADAVGSIGGFMVSLSIVIIWVLTGPFFDFSDTWQLIINTGTTIVTFLMVFLIQHTQNRDTAILNLKLDELIKSHHPANNSTINLSDLSDEELKALEESYIRICNKRQRRK